MPDGRRPFNGKARRRCRNLEPGNGCGRGRFNTVAKSYASHTLGVDGMFRRFVAFLLFCIPPVVLGQDNVSEIEKLRQQISLQQRQLDELKSLLEQQQKALERLSTTASPQTAVQQTKPEQPNPAALDTAALPKKGKEAPSYNPLSFRIGGAEFTPGGFMDLSAVWRSTNGGSGVATSFGSIPANNSPAGKLSEWRFSAYNSRATLKVTERPLENENISATAYLETDFAGTVPATAYVTSNSNSFRMRQAWGSVQIGKLEILGGQAWTLMTPNRSGTSPFPADIFLGLGQDSSYLAGLLWVRQGQVRATYKVTPHWTAAFSVENPQQYVTNGTLLPSNYSSQFDNSSGNSTVPNGRPEFVAKVAFDARPHNRSVHLELAGISRQFRTLTPDNTKHSAQGLGGSVNLIVEPVKNLRWILTTYFSSGGGRYIMGMGPDAVVGPDGTISPVHSYSGIAGLEYQFTRASQLFAYYNGAYFNRNFITVSPGNYLGFGYPGSSSLANRQIQEATIGYARIFWKNSNFGSFQAHGQYSYVTRAPWSVAPQSDSTMHTHMIFSGLRFTLP